MWYFPGVELDGFFFTLILHAQRLFHISKPITPPPPPQQALTRFLVKQRGIIMHSSVSPHTDKGPGAVATRLNGHETIYLSPDRDRQVPSNRKNQPSDCRRMRKHTYMQNTLGADFFGTDILRLKGLTKKTELILANFQIIISHFLF